MRIGFFSSERKHGTSTMRAAWPASWVNRFTNHIAFYYPMECIHDPSYMSEFLKLDVAVFHKQEVKFPELAKQLHANGCTIIYDTDDWDSNLFDMFYVSGEVGDVQSYIDQMVDIADGITVGSMPLLRKYAGSKPCAYIDNAFDTANYHNSAFDCEYYGDTLKVVYGGGISHYRDVEMFLRLGVIQQIMSERQVDFWFYGIGGEQRKRNYGKGDLFIQHGFPIYSYIEECYMDASLVVAPLVVNEFNECRSCLKLIEAGFAGLPIVCTDIQNYRDYIGRDLVTYTDNTAEGWYNAITSLLDNEEKRKGIGKEHRALVEKYYTAEEMTRQRIEFYEQVRSAK